MTDRRSSITRQRASEMIDLETILERGNLAVVRNKGGAGVDGMKVGELLTHGADLVTSIQEGRYKPSPVRRVFIPKENGEKRPLGIPTVVDRFVAQVLSAEYEKVFSDISHGFRPRRSCSTAMDRQRGVPVGSGSGFGEVL